MKSLTLLQQALNEKIADVMASCKLANDEMTIEVPADKLVQVCSVLRDDKELAFDCLMDVCGVDYLEYGIDEWQTQSATATGFDRGVKQANEKKKSTWKKPRFAVVYHLLSIEQNWRLRLRTFPTGDVLAVDSVIDIWQSANWFEREAYDLFGIHFNNHPDLRRILTDYGFKGHPMRKDFPLIGEVEVRYDHEKGRVIYQPVTIEPRILVPKVIRNDSRYIHTDEDTSNKEGVR